MACQPANGLLLDGAGDFVVGSSGGMVMQTPGAGGANVRTGKQIEGQAIHVIEE